jgi:hypothetical protein
MMVSMVSQPPSATLAALTEQFVEELAARPAPEPVVIRRGVVALIVAALGNVLDQIEALEEGAAAADRLTEELAIVRADRERWRLASEAYHAAWGREVERAERSPYQPMEKGRLERLHRRGVVVDLTEAFRRERASQPGTGPEGGAA